MEYSGRINCRHPAGLARAAHNRGIDSDHFSPSPAAPFCNAVFFSFGRNGDVSDWPGRNEKTKRGSRLIRPNDNNIQTKTMKTLYLLAGLRPALLILAVGSPLPLMLLAAGMVVVQPCAGQSGTWTDRQPRHRTRWPHGDLAAQRQGARRRRRVNASSLASAELYDPASGTWTATGSLAHRTPYLTRRRCCPTARCSSRADTNFPAAFSRAQNSTIRRAAPGRPPAASQTHGIRSHGDVAAERQGARRRRSGQQCQLSHERGALRSGKRHLDGHWQPRKRTR